MKILKPILVTSIFLTSLLTLPAAEITWGPATTASAESDVSTNGDLIEAINAAAVVVTEARVVNGVSFASQSILPSSFSGDFYPSAVPGVTGDYELLLSNTDLGGGSSRTIQIGVDQLIAGLRYEVQVWFADTRAVVNDRKMTFADGEGNSVILDGDVGQFAIGTFEADSTTQSLLLETNGFANVHLNAYQVRQISAVFEVTTLSDEFDSPAGSELSLREAIRDASPGDVITFAPSLDGGVIQLNADTIQNGERRGELLIEYSLMIDASALPSGITIDGGSDGNFALDANETRCFFISDATGDQLNVTFRNLTVRNGVSEEPGANIHTEEALRMEDCHILDGRAFGAGSGGGGIFQAVLRTIVMEKCSLIGNQSSGGGAEGGGILSRGRVELYSCEVCNNHTLGEFSSGGAISARFFEAHDSVISGNSTSGSRSSGGAFFTSGGGSFISCELSNNSTAGDLSRGGAIGTGEANLTLTSCRVFENHTAGASSHGGALEICDGRLTGASCVFFSNETTGPDSSGGAIYADFAEVNLEATTLTANSVTDGFGGAYFEESHKGTAEMRHLTITDNSAPQGQGGGLFISSSNTGVELILEYSIVRDNSGEDIRIAAGAVVVPTENLIGTGNDLSPFAASEINTAPILLAPLGDYGGPTETMPPLLASPAIDAASNSSATIDQRGALVIATPDIGATEFVPFTEVTIANSALFVTNLNDSDDQLEISLLGGAYLISDPTGIIDVSTIAGATGSGTPSVTVPLGAIDSLVVNTLGGNDSVTLQSLPGTLEGGVSITGGDDSDTIKIEGPLNTGAAGDLFLSAETISQSEGIVAGGLTSLVAENITLESPANDFNTISLTAVTTSIVDSNTLTLDQVTNSGELTIETLSGDILDTPAASIFIAGPSSWTAAGNIQLDHFDEHQCEGLVTLTAERITNFATFEDITFGKVTATGTANVNNQIQSGRGTITLTDDITTAGNSDVQLRMRGNVVQEGGRIVTDSLAVIATSPNIEANLPGENDVRMFVSNTRIGDPRVGDILFNDINELQLGVILSDQFTLTAGGNVLSQSPMVMRGASSITVQGDLTFQSSMQLSNTLSLNVIGVTSITSGATLSIDSLDGFDSASGVVIENIDPSPVSGTFENLPEGGSLVLGSNFLGLSYLGGDGNEIVLVAKDPFADGDSDGLADLLELALGTDPDVADFQSAARPALAFDPNGAPTITFGRGSSPISGTILIIERSTDLQTFEEIYRFDFDAATSNLGTGITEDLQASQFIITDEAAFDRAFYRITATLPE